MRYNIGDVVKYRHSDNRVYIGKIPFKHFGNDSDDVIEVETYGISLIVDKDCVIQNLTEEAEKENAKNDIESKVNALRRFAFSINVGDYIVPYSEFYEERMKQCFICKNGFYRVDDSKLIYCAATIYKVIKSDIKGFTFKVIKSKVQTTGSTFVIPTEQCEKEGYFLITDFIPEHMKNEFLEENEKLKEETKKESSETYGSKEHVEFLIKSCHGYKEQIHNFEKWLKEKQEANKILHLEVNRAYDKINELKLTIRNDVSWINKLTNDKKLLEMKINELEEANKDYANRIDNVYNFLTAICDVAVLDKKTVERIHNMLLGSEKYDNFWSF